MQTCHFSQNNSCNHRLGDDEQQLDHEDFPSLPRRTKLLLGVLLFALINLLSNISLIKKRLEVYAEKDAMLAGHYTAFWGMANSTVTDMHSTKSGYNESAMFRPQPFTGARDAAGQLGYVADVTAVRRWMQHRLSQASRHGQSADTTTARTFLPVQDDEEFYELCLVPIGHGFEEAGGAEVMGMVRVSPDIRTHALNQAQPLSTPPSIPPKVLCVVYTHSANHFRVRAIAETWGWRCDGFFAASTETVTDPNDIGFGAVNLTHAGPEIYDNMWQKTRSILAYVHANYLDEYDYFYLCGDDTHFIVENFLVYVSQLHSKSNEPLFLGSTYPDRNSVYVVGGPGYALNRVALERYVTDALQTCSHDWVVPFEDRALSNCLRSINIHPLDTADEEGRQRFHGQNPARMGNLRAFNWRNEQAAHNLWARTHGYKQGANITSPNTVSFHLMKTPIMMKRHHAHLYGSCEYIHKVFHQRGAFK